MKKYTVFIQKKGFLVVLALLFVLSAFLAMPPAVFAILGLAGRYLGRSLRDPGRWIEIIKHCAYIAMTVIALAAFLVCTKRGSHLADEVRRELCLWGEKIGAKRFAIAIAGIAIFYCICFFKVIVADFYYGDDIWRSYDGSRSWIGFSRYISEFLSIAIHGNLYLPDIAPLTQLIAILIMALATVLLAAVLRNGNITPMSLLACSLLFLSPFFAQNFSYRFDSPYMALAAFFPIVPFMFTEKRGAFFFVSVVSLILCCMCYQAGSSIFILLAMYFVLSMWLRKTITGGGIMFGGIAAGAYLCAMLVFKILYMNTMENSADSNFSTAITLAAIPGNIAAYAKSTLPFFGGVWTKCFLFLSTVCFVIASVREAKCGRVRALIFVLLFVAVGFILSFGPYLVFERPLLAPRAMLGFNMLVALVCAGMCGTEGKKVRALPICCLVYGCAVFMYAYGTSLAEQKEYQRFRTELLLSDLGRLANGDAEIGVSFSGSIGLSDGLHVNARTFPLIGKTVTVVPSGGGIWNDDLMKSLGFKCRDEYLGENPGWPLLVSSYWHDIYGEDGRFFIVLKRHGEAG
ncbi:MAG: glucosyltransferase domain-containing protein [Treponema sp.]|nr:glucosyltransferase domain-containing protein [Treponema sp.]